MILYIFTHSLPYPDEIMQSAMSLRSFITPSASSSTAPSNCPTSSSDSSAKSDKLDLVDVLDERMETDSGSNCARFIDKIW
ncbi:hypothetical protein HanRHA438_Chr07g0313241 [Helianthus annuus]|nr:hypothetical protein HanIR_Chr07g0327231 [Helianthus annuus]KAJ0908690.1 hypothetical protein HanRHA438_Chr07g0313241 [Helianthus annuus]